MSYDEAKAYALDLLPLPGTHFDLLNEGWFAARIVVKAVKNRCIVCAYVYIGSGSYWDRTKPTWSFSDWWQFCNDHKLVQYGLQ